MLLLALPSPAVVFAMDRATVRTRDANGFLHVELSNISKANVCPYHGREIPDWQALGLDPDRVYQLYRDPDELARAATTFNNLPLLSEHLPVVPEELPEGLIIGSTGDDATFEAPYLRNSLVIWCGAHQQAIDANRKRELSCGYRYRADMTPGHSLGVPYDGVMRDIIGNHVALVVEGRAGPDVLVGDEAMKLKSRTALMVTGAVAALIRPKLAKDAKVDLSSALKGVNTKSMAVDGAPKTLAGQLAALTTGKLAKDATLDVDELAQVIEAVQAAPEDEDEIAEDDKPDDQRENETDEEYAARKKREMAANDADPDKSKDKPAMDAATVTRLIAEAEQRGAARIAAIDQAKRDVQPFVGEVVGMDSAPAIYRLALDAAKVDLNGVPDTAFAAMVRMLPKPGERPMATDAAAATTHHGDFAKRFPNAAKLKRI